MWGMGRRNGVATVAEVAFAVAVAAAVVNYIVVDDFDFAHEDGMFAAANKAIVVAAVGMETAVAGLDTMVVVDVLAETVALVVVGIAVMVLAGWMLGVGENILVGTVVVVEYATAAAQLAGRRAATVEEAAVVAEERTVM